jgi:hypothetical protein
MHTELVREARAQVDQTGNVEANGDNKRRKYLASVQSVVEKAREFLGDPQKNISDLNNSLGQFAKKQLQENDCAFAARALRAAFESTETLCRALAEENKAFRDALDPEDGADNSADDGAGDGASALDRPCSAYPLPDLLQQLDEVKKLYRECLELNTALLAAVYSEAGGGPGEGPGEVANTTYTAHGETVANIFDVIQLDVPNRLSTLSKTLAEWTPKDVEEDECAFVARALRRMVDVTVELSDELKAANAEYVAALKAVEAPGAGPAANQDAPRSGGGPAPPPPPPPPNGLSPPPPPATKEADGAAAVQDGQSTTASTGLLQALQQSQPSCKSGAAVAEAPTTLPENCTALENAQFKCRFKNSLSETVAALTTAEKAALCAHKRKTPAQITCAGCTNPTPVNKPSKKQQAVAKQKEAEAEKALATAKEALDVAQKAYNNAKDAKTAAENKLRPAEKEQIDACEASRKVPVSNTEGKKNAQEKCDAATAALKAVQDAIENTKKAASDGALDVTAAKKKVTDLTPQRSVVDRMRDRRMDLDGDGDGDESSSTSVWSEDGGGANDDDEGDADDVFEPALQRVMISMLLKNRRLSATECVRRICAGDFSDCQLPCLAEQRLVRGFVGYPYYRDVVHRAVHRLHPLLQLRYR